MKLFRVLAAAFKELEYLHTAIVRIGNKNPVTSIYPDPTRKLKLARGLTFAANRHQETPLAIENQKMIVVTLNYIHIVLAIDGHTLRPHQVADKGTASSDRCQLPPCR